MVIFAVASLVIFIPLWLIIRNRPEQYGYLPDGDAKVSPDADETQAPVPADEVNITAGQAIKSRLFWQITVGISLMFVAITAVSTHVMPYLSTIGINRATSGLIAGALPLTSLIGRVGVGWFGDKYNRKTYEGACQNISKKKFFSIKRVLPFDFHRNQPLRHQALFMISDNV